jgi:hypothetical protein
MADLRRSPAESLLQEAESVLQIEPATVRAPQEIEIRLSGTIPPQPELARLTGLSGQALYLYEHYGAAYDRRSLIGFVSGAAL